MSKGVDLDINTVMLLQQKIYLLNYEVYNKLVAEKAGIKKEIILFNESLLEEYKSLVENRNKMLNAFINAQKEITLTQKPKKVEASAEEIVNTLIEGLKAAGSDIKSIIIKIVEAVQSGVAQAEEKVGEKAGAREPATGQEAGKLGYAPAVTGPVYERAVIVSGGQTVWQKSDSEQTSSSSEQKEPTKPEKAFAGQDVGDLGKEIVQLVKELSQKFGGFAGGLIKNMTQDKPALKKIIYGA